MSENLLQEHRISRKTVTTAASFISQVLKEELLNELRESPFSLSLDLSSDLYGHSYLAICVRFHEKDNYEKPITKLFSILPITNSSTGEVIFEKLMASIFIEEEIKMNIMGIVTDGGSNMTGSEKGVSHRLK